VRDIEKQFLESFSKNRYVSSKDKAQLFSEPLGAATSEFLDFVQKEELFRYDENGILWLQLERFKKSPENQKQALSNIDQLLTAFLDGSWDAKKSLNTNKVSKEAGTYMMNVSRELIRQVYLSGDSSLIELFSKHVPVPPARLFEENSVPESIKVHEQQVEETIKKVALKTLEPFILKAQRHIRGTRRQREELHRIKMVHARGLDYYKLTAEKLMQDANTPYEPQCGLKLRERIMDAAKKVSAFSTVKHITSEKALQSVLDDALYGRRTLLDFYMTFNPASLWPCDVLNGDGNVVCLGPQMIDPKAAGSIVIEFDLPKLLRTNPSAFYKQKDLEYGTDKRIRAVSLGKEKIYFDHTPGFVRNSDTETAYLQMYSKDGGVEHTSEVLKSTFIAYDFKHMHEILTLNFFRFMDQMTDPNYISNFYKKVERLSDEALGQFLADIEKNMTDTAEFNFYGAHQINFSTITKITDREKGFTLNLPVFLNALNSGDLNRLRDARESLPSVFQSYRFLDYLLTHTQHAEARYYLDDLRKQCKTPNWIQYTPLSIPNEFEIHWDTKTENIKDALKLMKSGFDDSTVENTPAPLKK